MALWGHLRACDYTIFNQALVEDILPRPAKDDWSVPQETASATDLIARHIHNSIIRVYRFWLSAFRAVHLVQYLIVQAFYQIGFNLFINVVL